MSQCGRSFDRDDPATLSPSQHPPRLGRRLVPVCYVLMTAGCLLGAIACLMQMAYTREPATDARVRGMVLWVGPAVAFLVGALGAAVLAVSRLATPPSFMAHSWALVPQLVSTQRLRALLRGGRRADSSHHAAAARPATLTPGHAHLASCRCTAASWRSHRILGLLALGPLTRDVVPGEPHLGCSAYARPGASDLQASPRWPRTVCSGSRAIVDSDQTPASDCTAEPSRSCRPGRSIQRTLELTRAPRPLSCRLGPSRITPPGRQRPDPGV